MIQASADFWQLAGAVRLAEKVIAVALAPSARLRRTDRNCDRLNVLIAMPFQSGALAQRSERVDPGRIVGPVIVPFQPFAHHQLRPPSTRPFVGPPCSFLSQSHSSQRPAAVDMPAR
jgi:hypothetical protein